MKLYIRLSFLLLLMGLMACSSADSTTPSGIERLQQIRESVAEGGLTNFVGTGKDYCGRKYPKPHQELDRIRCRAEGTTGIGGGDTMRWYEFTVSNNTPRTVYVALLSYDDDPYNNDSCVGGCPSPWKSRGWWTLGPYQSRHLLNSSNQYVYLYAVNDFGNYWGRGDHYAWVIDAQFHGDERGVPNRDGAYQAGFTKIDLGSSYGRYTFTLNP